MKGGKHRPCPPDGGNILEAVRLLWVLGWLPEETEAVTEETNDVHQTER